jgi:hypothetical protein
MKKIWIGVLVGCASLGAFAAFAQQAAPGARVIQVPFGRGIYYQGPAGWVSLPSSIFMPFYGSAVKEFFGGPRDLEFDMAGSHAVVAVANTRPTFYMRGYRPGSQLRLVRGIEKQDYRKLRLAGSRDHNVWGTFHPEDLTEVEMESIADGLVTLKPRTDLKPGEYVLVSALDGYREIRLAFDFGVAATATR